MFARRKWRAALGAVALTVGVGVGTTEAQVELTSRAMRINVGGRAHLQFNHTSIDTSAVQTSFLLRRARLEIDVTISDLVSGRFQSEFGEGKVGLRDAYMRLNFDPSFRVTAGQFKRPFDVFELVSSTQILVIERAGGVRGAANCSGIGDVCSLSRFTEKLEYSDRDVGVMVDGSIGESGFGYAASITNGRGANIAIDENGAKSYTGRLEYNLSGLRIGAHVGVHDYVNDTTGTDEYATAFGADVDWGRYERPGLHIKAGVVYGDNWKNLTTADPSKFLTAQGVVTYLVPVDGGTIYGVEPVGRVSWGDPDRSAGGDEGWLVTPGVVFYLVGRNKFAVNGDVWVPRVGDAEFSVKAQLYLHF